MTKTKYLILTVILSLAAFLRIYDLNVLPNGLHWDEMDTGYQAYSLIKTGKDYFGNKIPLFAHSWADYRTPVYIYSAVPFVAKLGMTTWSVRLPSVVWAILGIILSYILSVYIFGDTLYALITPLVFAVSPWHIQYSRQSVETISLNTCFLLGLTCFYKGLKNPKWLILSGLGFGLGVAAYSPGKLFIPLFLMALTVIYFKKLLKINIKYLAAACAAFLIIAAPIIGDGFWGKSGLRFHDLSIFTDPTVGSQIGFKRLEFAVSSGIEKKVGMQPRLIDKIIYNKPTEWLKSFVSNYLTTYSTDFLFIKGDPEPRHSPAKDSIGQLHIIEILPFLLGLYFLVKSKSWMLGSWLLLAPIPSALTRDGGNHAARLFILFPALALVITLGIIELIKKSKIIALGYGILLFISCLHVFSYFFANYRWESAKPFNWGFSEIIQIAIDQSQKYNNVIVDVHGDSALMAYLFTSKFDPAKFQSLLPLKTQDPISGMSGFKMGNIWLLQPGNRDWYMYLTSKQIPEKTLIIAAGDEPYLKKIDSLKVINYPDSSEAFYIFPDRRF